MFPNLHDAADMLKRLPALLRPTTPTEPPMSTPPITAPTSPLRWAIVELFGHATIAGAISEEAFGGGTFTRIDVPEVSWPDEVYVQGKPEVTMRVIAAHSKLFAVQHHPGRRSRRAGHGPPRAPPAHQAPPAARRPARTVGPRPALAAAGG
jgi:hypothetical protein